MKKIFIWLCAIAMWLSLAAFGQERVALLIAVDKYENWPSLKTPVKDCQAIAEVLQKHYGFTVKTLYNEQVTAAAVLKAIKELIRQTGPQDEVIIYYAGHGYRDPELSTGYWVPANGGKDTSGFIANSVLADSLRVLKCQHLLLVSDSCFSGTLLKQQRDIEIEENEEEMASEKPSRQCFTSGSEEQKVDDENVQGHSPFAYYFRDSLLRNKKEAMPVSSLVKDVKLAMERNTSQKPGFGPLLSMGDQGGEFYFKRREQQQEQDAAELKRKQEELQKQLAADAEKRKLEELQKQQEAELKRKLEEQAAAELKRKLEEQEAEFKRKLEDMQKQQAADAARQAEIKKLEELRKQQEADAAHQAEIKRRQEEQAEKRWVATSADNRYKKSQDGIIWDTATKLEWLVGPDKDTNWLEAKEWVDGLKTFDGGRWRLPLAGELQKLYQKGKSRYNIDPFFAMSGSWVWSGDIAGSYANCVLFYAGKVAINPASLESNKNGRAFAVRRKRQ